MGRRSQTQDIEQQRLVVPLPAVWDEPIFRTPPMSDCLSPVQEPGPVSALV